MPLTLPPDLPAWADPDSPHYDTLRAFGEYPELDGLDRPPAPQPPPPRPRPLLLTTAQVAALLGVSPGTVRRKIRAGRLRAAKAGETTQARWAIPVFEVESRVGRRVDVREELP